MHSYVLCYFLMYCTVAIEEPACCSGEAAENGRGAAYEVLRGQEEGDHGNNRDTGGAPPEIIMCCCVLELHM
jgi:hypothetical protein